MRQRVRFGHQGPQRTKLGGQPVPVDDTTHDVDLDGSGRLVYTEKPQPLLQRLLARSVTLPSPAPAPRGPGRPKKRGKP